MWFGLNNLQKDHEISVHPRPIWKSNPLSPKHIGCCLSVSGLDSVESHSFISPLTSVNLAWVQFLMEPTFLYNRFYSFLSPIPFLLHHLFPSTCFFVFLCFLLFSSFLPFYYSPSFFLLSHSSIFLVFFLS